MDSNQRRTLAKISKVEDAVFLAVTGVSECANSEITKSGGKFGIGFGGLLDKRFVGSFHVTKLAEFVYKHSSFSYREVNRGSNTRLLDFSPMPSLLCDLGVAARVVNGDRILLVQEAKGPHATKWGFPKGHVDNGESPEQAALRELMEESGLQGRVMGLAGVRTALRKDEPAVFLCYDVHVDEHEQSSSSDEISSIQWFSLGEISSLPWVSETMHQLAIDGLTQRRLMPSHQGLTPRTNPYAVYRTSTTEQLQRGDRS